MDWLMTRNLRLCADEGVTSESFQDLSFFLHQFFLLLVLNFLIGRKLLARTAAIVIRVFCFA